MCFREELVMAVLSGIVNVFHDVNPAFYTVTSVASLPFYTVVRVLLKTTNIFIVNLALLTVASEKGQETVRNSEIGWKMTDNSRILPSQIACMVTSVTCTIIFVHGVDSPV